MFKPSSLHCSLVVSLSGPFRARFSENAPCPLCQDMFIAHIGGMDCLARGLIGACKLVQEGLMKKALEARCAYQTISIQTISQASHAMLNAAHAISLC